MTSTPADREMLSAIAAVWALVDALDVESQRRVLSHVVDVRREIVDLLAGLPTTTDADGVVTLSATYLTIFAADLRRIVERWANVITRTVADDLTRAAEITDTGFRGALSALARASGVPAPLIVLTPLGPSAPVVTAALLFSAAAMRSVSERIAAAVSLEVQRTAYGAQSHAEAVTSVRGLLAADPAWAGKKLPPGTQGALTAQVTGVVRTGLYSIANVAAAHAHREALDELPGVESVWLTVRDKRVDPVCVRLEGRRKPPGGTFPGGFIAPPAHPSCRCRLGVAVARAGGR